MKYIDSILNRITMYRLTLYYLTVLVVAAVVCGFFGLIPYSGFAIITSIVITTLTCWASNEIFAKIFNAPTNIESAYITGFILTLIIAPTLPNNVSGMLFLFVASILAMASKYILAIGKKHMFNPAAIAVVITYFSLNDPASWWVGGNVPLLPFVLIGGLLLTRKIQRFDLVLSFFIAAVVIICTHSWPQSPLITMQKIVEHTPIFCLGFIMLTEPLTTPPTRHLRMIYGAVVGVLFAPFVHVGTFYSTPELALVVGNLFSYIVSPKVAVTLTLEKIEQVGAGMYNFIFATDKKFAFEAGQYLEWTLPHKNPDARGYRRYFTINSSPTADKVELGVKFYEPSSTFKKKLLELSAGDKLSANALAGDFTLPKDPTLKLAFIAGGIGITPFKSMLEYLMDTKQKRDIVLFYSNRSADEIAFKEVFSEAEQKLGIKTVYTLTSETGRLDSATLKKSLPDFKERLFYLSGPRNMVKDFEKTLTSMGVSRLNIKTDFFPGFV